MKDKYKRSRDEWKELAYQLADEINKMEYYFKQHAPVTYQSYVAQKGLS